MSPKIYLIFTTTFFLYLSSCSEKSEPTIESSTPTYIASYEQALESVIRSIPEEYINKARTTLNIAYQHTSHGTHVSYGMFGLPHFKDGDSVLFGISSNPDDVDMLTLYDYGLSAYGVNDLSSNETGFIQATRAYLDNPDNAAVNVIMWSWCDISTHKVAENYLPGMDSLINEYAAGGSKIGNGKGQRTTPVSFIFMTGHANPNANLCETCPQPQADTIINFCKVRKQFCLDYYGIDSHDMLGNYWDDVNDNGYSDAYGGNFYQEWQDAHVLGVDYYENLSTINGGATYGQHTSQHITSNRKAYAMWWILARIAGWNGISSN